MDNNATTPISEEVQEAMQPYLNHAFGNPSAIHGVGRDARDGLEASRRQVARLINARPRSIIFTGGGSESDNLALKGVAFKYNDKGNHIITTTIEHPAILKTCQFLETIGFEITYLEVDKTGQVKPEELMKAIKDNTILVSIMLANNEVGTN